MAAASEQNIFERFTHPQSSGSIVLLPATLTAIIWANSPSSDVYHTLSHLDIGIHFAGNQYQLSPDQQTLAAILGSLILNKSLPSHGQ